MTLAGGCGQEGSRFRRCSTRVRAACGSQFPGEWPSPGLGVRMGSQSTLCLAVWVVLLWKGGGGARMGGIREGRGHGGGGAIHSGLVRRGVVLGPRDALEGQGPQRWPQRRLDRRLEEAGEPLGAGNVGYKCHGAWHLASGKRSLGIGCTPWRVGGFPPPSPLPMHPCWPPMVAEPP